MRIVLPVVFVAFLLAWSPASRAQDPAAEDVPALIFDAHVALQWMPLDAYEDDGLILPITVNGHATYAEVDTGSTLPGSVLLSSKLLSEAEKAKFGKPVVTEAYGGTKFYPRARVAELTIGGIYMKNEPVTVTDQSFGRDARVQATIGIDFLRKWALQVEWQQHRARFLIGGDLPKGAATIPVRIDPKSRFATLDATICGVTVAAVLDSGADNDVNLVPEREELQGCVHKRSDIRSMGSGGPLVSGRVSIPSIEIGGIRRGSIFASIDPAGGPLSGHGFAASIGYGVLRRSSFVLDAGGGGLLLYGADRTADVLDPSHVGIQFREDLDGLLITHLMLGSPASETTLKPGGRICALNGETIAELKGRYGDINPPVGQTVQVRICGGETVSIVARDYLGAAELAARFASAPPTPIVEPVGVGRVTEAFDRCTTASGREAANACSIVLNAPGISTPWKDLARARRSAVLPGLAGPGE